MAAALEELEAEFRHVRPEPRVDHADQGGYLQLAVFRRDGTLMTLMAESGAS